MTDLALGTYRCRDIPRAAAHAVTRGATWIDTAPNYLSGEAHTKLAPILKRHPTVRISTKTGIFTRLEGEEAARKRILTHDQAATGRSLRPDFLRWQTDRSLTALGRADLVFVHNPPGRTALRDAFTVLEEYACDGRIGGYGVATWTGFDTRAFTVAELLELARESTGGPEHHLKAVQFPVSLVKARPIALALAGRGPLVEADAHGLSVFASAPLHGGELTGLVTPELARLIGPGLTPAQAALHVVASTPGVTRVLLSTDDPAHWDAALHTFALEPLPGSSLRKVLDVLGT